MYFSKTKGGRKRSVYLDQSTLSLLREFKASRSVLSEFVFTMGDGKVMFPTSPTRYFKSFGERYGFRNFHPHLMRHSFASISLTAGGDVVSVSEVLGHADPGVTLKMYAHSNEEARKTISNLVQQALEK